MTSEPPPRAARLRREPPPFRVAAVRRVERRSARLVGITLAGPELEGFPVPEPAASVRLLLPSPGAADFELPAWNGNEYLQADGRRPVIRTFTPRRVDPALGEIDVEIVLHGHGAACDWAGAAAPGDPVAVSGPGRGYAIDRGAPGFLLAGDETALPAMCQLLEALPADRPVRVLIEVAAPEARLPLPHHPGAGVTWCDLPPEAPPGDALVAAVRREALAPGTRAWVAGEAAAVQRIRRHFFDDLGLRRSEAVVRGYWKAGRAGTGDGG